MVSGIELIAGFLIAWAARKARRAGVIVDEIVDDAIDESLERLHELVKTKLQGDPALQRLEQQAAQGDVSMRTQQRLTLAIEEAADADETFAAQIESIIQRLSSSETSSADGNVHVSNYGQVKHGNFIGSINGGSLLIDQSERRAAICFCGWEARATCRKCGEAVCQTHFFPSGTNPTYAVIQGALNEPQHEWFRNNDAYQHFLQSGTTACIFCRVKEADVALSTRFNEVRAWLTAPASLTRANFDRYAEIISVLKPRDARVVLKHAFHLFQAAMDIVHLDSRGNLTKGVPAISIGQNEFAGDYFACETGAIYMKDLHLRFADDHRMTSIVVIPQEAPDITRNGGNKVIFTCSRDYPKSYTNIQDHERRIQRLETGLRSRSNEQHDQRRSVDVASLHNARSGGPT
ncbi:hypothetical protein [Amycolatopsis rifamycinica]|uniref:hypothetical protein n=1 Tax=Amycolatopsis rifamycinica TaxID=287986 RepID=UPI00126A2684|nr:hypothetical protein [Amycolatopsis rifamycinica]